MLLTIADGLSVSDIITILTTAFKWPSINKEVAKAEGEEKGIGCNEKEGEKN